MRHNTPIALLIKAGRESYRDEMQAVMEATTAVFETEAALLYEKLRADKHGAKLCAMEKEAVRVEPSKMTHDRFLPTLTWAQEKNIAKAVRQLSEVGVIRSDGELSDLLQQGRHRLFGEETQKGVFAKHDSLEFWMGLVTLYMMGLHERAGAAFNDQVENIAKTDELRVAPAKSFDRIMVKAFKYRDEFDLEGFEAAVLAPLYVTDVLRCTFELQSAERVLWLREEIPVALPVVREQNLYSRKAAGALCGHRDMVIHALIPCGLAGGHVITEIRLMLAEYVELEKRSRGLKDVVRGDFSNGDTDLDGMTRQPLANYLLPNLRELQQATGRKLGKGSLLIALALSFGDLGTSVAAGAQYVALGNYAAALTTFAILGGGFVGKPAVSYFDCVWRRWKLMFFVTVEEREEEQEGVWGVWGGRRCVISATRYCAPRPTPYQTTKPFGQPPPVCTPQS